MPVYNYNALDRRGKLARGIINADSARAARTKLRQSGLSPQSCSRPKRLKPNNGVARSVNYLCSDASAPKTSRL